MPAPNQTPSLKVPLGPIATILGLAGSLLITGAGVVRYLAPLGDLPGEVQTMSDDINTIGRVQAVQTEALKTLAEVASDTKSMRRDVDRHSTEIEVVKQRLSHIEKR